MVYHNQDPLQKAKFLNRASYLAEKGSDADLTELRPSAKRTNKQSNCFRAWCSLIAETIKEPDVRAVERDVKRTILGKKIVTNVLTGESEEDDYHTSDMSEEEMSNFLTAVKQWAWNAHKWWLPSREDPGFDQMMQEYGRQ